MRGRRVKRKVFLVKKVAGLEKLVVCLFVEAGMEHARGRLCRWVGEGGRRGM